MNMRAKFLRLVQPEVEEERMLCRKTAAEAEARSIELHKTVVENHDELVTALRDAFQRALNS